jgi:hypothetical protein
LVAFSIQGQGLTCPGTTTPAEALKSIKGSSMLSVDGKPAAGGGRISIKAEMKKRRLEQLRASSGQGTKAMDTPFVVYEDV